jgi:hypothetical protein
MAAVGNDAATRVIVDTQPPVSYYLEREHAVYIPRHTPFRFDNVSRVQGTVHLWSNQRLLSTHEEVREYTRGAETVWLVRYSGPGRDPNGAGRPLVGEVRAVEFHPEEIWGDRLIAAERRFVGEDGRIEVVRLQLGPGESAI